MQFRNVALAFAAFLLTVDATFIIGTAGTVGVGAAAGAAALAGVAGLALGAGLVGAAVLARRRGKRGVAELEKENMVFDMVAAADVYGCALKLVCLIESKPDDQLNEEDQLILQLFGRQPDQVDEVKTSRQAYFYAAYLGTSQGKDACQKVFHTCDISYGQMIDYVRAVRV